MQALLLMVLCTCGLLNLAIVFMIYKGQNKTGGSGSGTVSPPATTPVSSKAPEPDPKTEDAMFKKTQANCNQLIAHLKTDKYKNDARAKKLVTSFKKLQKMSKSVKDLYGESWGETISINMWEGPSGLRTMASVNSTLVHELAHTLTFDEPASHGPRWKVAYTWLATVASAELGWPIAMTCRICEQYQVCSKSQCPACKWECASGGR